MNSQRLKEYGMHANTTDQSPPTAPMERLFNNVKKCVIISLIVFAATTTIETMFAKADVVYISMPKASHIKRSSSQLIRVFVLRFGRLYIAHTLCMIFAVADVELQLIPAIL